MQALNTLTASDGDLLLLQNPPRPAIRLFFLIHSLETGGAERQLIELVRGLDKTRFAVTVATCYDGGALLPEMQQIDGVQLISLGKKARWQTVSFLRRLLQIAREVRPHIVLGNYGLSNLLSLVVGRAAGARVVWTIRASYMDFSRYDRLSAWLFRADAWLSRWPDLIIANSHAGRQHRIAAGYSGRRMIVVQNGVDVERFRPDREGRRQMREEWRVSEKDRLIGLAARLDAMKDHPTFLRAAALLSQARADVRFVCVGSGPDPYRAELRRLGEELGLAGRLIWAGERRDMPAVYSAFDVATLSSYGEGLPNVVAEAMACGVPCAVTDVGDAAEVVGQTGYVVRPRDAPALMQAWLKLLNLPARERAAMSEAARDRIVSRFAVQQLADRTEAALVALL